MFGKEEEFGDNTLSGSREGETGRDEGLVKEGRGDTAAMAGANSCFLDPIGSALTSPWRVSDPAGLEFRGVCCEPVPVISGGWMSAPLAVLGLPG